MRRNTILLACALALGCTVSGFGLMHLFPDVERAFLDWQITVLSQQVDDSRVVIISPPTAAGRPCPSGRWHPEEFESVLGMAGQAGALVVASLEDFSQESGVGCGDLGSLARLAETTKRVGNVVYPDTASAMLKQAGLGVGSVGIALETDDVFPNVMGPSPLKPDAGLPLGLFAASFVTNQNMPLESIFGISTPRLVPSSFPSQFSVQSYERVKDLLYAQDPHQLTRLFEDKVVLVSAQPVGRSPASPRPQSDRVVRAHAQLANAAITGSWLAMIPLGAAFFWTWAVAGILAVSSLQSDHPLPWRWGGPAVGIVGLVMIGFLPKLGWLWPMGGTLTAGGLTCLTVLLWNTWQTQAGLEGRIGEGQGKLARLQSELVNRQEVVRELEAQLEGARSRVHRSDSVISDLQGTQATIRLQLRDSQGAVAETQMRIRQLEGELDALRKLMPVSSSLEKSALSHDRDRLSRECGQAGILTRDPKLLDLFGRLKRAALSPSPILLLGETGTGKEVFARAAHSLSPRRSGPFISVNMAAIRPELFEGELFGHVKGAFTGAVGRTGLLQAAHGGTIFLDEVGELQPDVQAKLLRVLEDGSFYRVGESRLTKVDVRIVAATNRDLEQDVAAGRYREDLYYRLRSIVLALPPLRERCSEDRRLLAQSFLETLGGQQGRCPLQFTQGAMDAIQAYHWPGNVRELKQNIGQAVALTEGGMITEVSLNIPPVRRNDAVRHVHGPDDLERREDQMVLQCLRRHRFDMQATARELNWDRSTVTQRLKGLGFQALVEHHQDLHAAARALAGEEGLVRLVESRLREYTKNLIPNSKEYRSADEAIADCRKRFRNIPERYFPAVERLIQARFSPSVL